MLSRDMANLVIWNSFERHLTRDRQQVWRGPIKTALAPPTYPKQLLPMLRDAIV